MKMTFVNSNDVEFTVYETELGTPGTTYYMTPLTYIKYCLDRGCVLVGIEN